jgi:hypothetical protein
MLHVYRGQAGRVGVFGVGVDDVRSHDVKYRRSGNLPLILNERCNSLTADRSTAFLNLSLTLLAVNAFTFPPVNGGHELISLAPKIKVAHILAFLAQIMMSPAQRGT